VEQERDRKGTGSTARRSTKSVSIFPGEGEQDFVHQEVSSLSLRETVKYFVQ